MADDIRALIAQVRAEDAANIEQQYAAKKDAEIAMLRDKPIEQKATNYFQQYVLPAAGMTFGSIAGMPLGPMGSAAGAGLGMAAANQVGRFGQSVADYLAPLPGPISRVGAENRNLTLGQNAVNAAHDVFSGGLMDLAGPAVQNAGRAIGGGVSSIMGMNRFTPVDQAFMEASKRQGIPFTAGAAGASAPLSGLEHMPTRFPIGSQAARPTFENIRLQAQRAGERLGASLGPDVGLEYAGKAVQQDLRPLATAQLNAPTELVDQTLRSMGPSTGGKLGLGRSTQEALGTAEKAARSSASAVYDAAISAEGSLPLRLSSSNAVAADMLTLERRLGALGKQQVAGPAGAVKNAGKADNPNIADLPPQAVMDLVRMGKGTPGPVDLQSLPDEFIQKYGLARNSEIPMDLGVEMLQRLRGLIRNAGDPDVKRRLGLIEQGLIDDMDASGGPMIKAAGSNYRRTVAEFWAKDTPLGKAQNMEAGAFADRVLRGQDVDLLEPLMAKIPDAQKREIRQAVLERLRGTSLNVGTGEVDPIKFATNLDRITPEARKLIFGDREKDVMGLRQNLLKNFGPGSKSDPIEAMLDGKGEALVNSLTTGKVKSTENFDGVWNVIGDDAKQKVRAATFNRVLADSFDNKTNEFSMERFMTAKNRVPREIWDRMLSGNPAQSLKDMETVFARNIQYARASANPSGTAGAVLGPAQIGAAAALGASAAFGREDPDSFAKKLLAVLSPYLIGRGVFSGPGQKLLMGRPAPIGAPPNQMLKGLATTGLFGATRE